MPLHLSELQRERLGKVLARRIPSRVGCEAAMKEIQSFKRLDLEDALEEGVQLVGREEVEAERRATAVSQLHLAPIPPLVMAQPAHVADPRWPRQPKTGRRSCRAKGALARMAAEAADIPNAEEHSEQAMMVIAESSLGAFPLLEGRCTREVGGAT